MKGSYRSWRAFKDNLGKYWDTYSLAKVHRGEFWDIYSLTKVCLEHKSSNAMSPRWTLLPQSYFGSTAAKDGRFIMSHLRQKSKRLDFACWWSCIGKGLRPHPFFFITLDPYQKSVVIYYSLKVQEPLGLELLVYSLRIFRTFQTDGAQHCISAFSCSIEVIQL